MDNILAGKIQNAKLTKVQEKIAKYFLKNQGRIGSMSSMEAAKEIGVSDASIIRFARAIGYSGFSELKEDFYNSLVENAYSDLSLSERMDQSREQYPSEEMSTQYLDLMQQNLIKTFQNNPQESYESVAAGLIAARKRFVIGLRGCKGAAMQFSRLLSFMLPEVTCLLDSECTSINMLQDVGEQDAVLMFAFARYYKIDVEYLKLAKEKKAKIYLVTDEFINPLASYADITLLADTDHMSFFNSALGAVTIGEYLLTLISRKVDFQDRIQRRDAITAYQRL